MMQEKLLSAPGLPNGSRLESRSHKVDILHPAISSPP